MLEKVKLLEKHKESLAAAAVIITAVLSGPLVDEVKDVFGTPVMYHPVTVWVVVFCIIFAQTKKPVLSLLCVIGYELIKFIWKSLQLEAPKVARVRKILHNVNTETEMSDHDIDFLNKVTPKNVKVVAKKTDTEVVA